jgi:hypothetical protein
MPLICRSSPTRQTLSQPPCPVPATRPLRSLQPATRPLAALPRVRVRVCARAGVWGACRRANSSWNAAKASHPSASCGRSRVAALKARVRLASASSMLSPASSLSAAGALPPAAPPDERPGPAAAGGSGTARTSAAAQARTSPGPDAAARERLTRRVRRSCSAAKLAERRYRHDAVRARCAAAAASDSTSRSGAAGRTAPWRLAEGCGGRMRRVTR